MAGIVSRTGGDRVGDGGTGYGTYEGGGEDGDLGRPAGIVAGDDHGEIDEKPTQTDPRGQHAEEDEQEDILRHHADGNAVDALIGHVEVVHDAQPAGAAMFQRSGHPGAGIGEDQE